MTNQKPPNAWRDHAMALAYLNGLADPVVVLDDAARVCEANGAFARFAASDRAALLDQPVASALGHLPRIAPLVDALEGLAQDGATGQVLLELEFAGQPGQAIVLTGIPLALEGGPPLLAIRMEDITEMARERAEIDAQRMAANESTRALERLNKELEGFSYSVAHDLRAPLRFIDKFAYLLLEHHSEELSSEGLQYAGQIREGTRQMAQLVEDLLRFSRVTGQELKREAIDMDRLVAGVIEEARYDIDGREVSFQVADLGAAEGDPALIRQVVANLIGNAVKFTRLRDKAEIAVARTGDPAVYTVSDNGVGFDAGEAERLFTVFQRFHQPEDFEGSGVGLAIVKRIVSRHGGSAWAESRVGEGARFHFTLEANPEPRGGA